MKQNCDYCENCCKYICSEAFRKHTQQCSPSIKEIIEIAFIHESRIKINKFLTKYPEYIKAQTKKFDKKINCREMNLWQGTTLSFHAIKPKQREIKENNSHKQYV